MYRARFIALLCLHYKSTNLSIQELIYKEFFTQSIVKIVEIKMLL